MLFIVWLSLLLHFQSQKSGQLPRLTLRSINNETDHVNGTKQQVFDLMTRWGRLDFQSSASCAIQDPADSREWQDPDNIKEWCRYNNQVVTSLLEKNNSFLQDDINYLSFFRNYGFHFVPKGVPEGLRQVELSGVVTWPVVKHLSLNVHTNMLLTNERCENCPTVMHIPLGQVGEWKIQASKAEIKRRCAFEDNGQLRHHCYAFVDLVSVSFNE